MKFRIGLETARCIILETCEILWRVLGKTYVSPPNMEEWNTISENFLSATGLPHCLGAVDGKNIRITCPPKCGLQYFNYKKFNSIVLLAVCDSNYIFTLVDVGAYDRQSDGGVFKNSEFGKQILNKTLNVPAAKYFFPHFFVADAAFPLKENIMKPYSKITDATKEKFVKSILTVRWRVLRTCISFGPGNAKKVVLATIVLHNFLRFNTINSRDPKTALEMIQDAENQNLKNVTRNDLHTANTSSQSALNLRNK